MGISKSQQKESFKRLSLLWPPCGGSRNIRWSVLPAALLVVVIIHLFTTNDDGVRIGQEIHFLRKDWEYLDDDIHGTPSHPIIAYPPERRESVPGLVKTTSLMLMVSVDRQEAVHNKKFAERKSPQPNEKRSRKNNNK